MPGHPPDPFRDRHANALANLAAGVEGQPVEVDEMDDATTGRLGVEDGRIAETFEEDAETSLGGPPPFPDMAPVGPRSQAGREPGHVRLARTTIPIALTLAAVTPVLGIAWFILPRSSPLKVGGPSLALLLAAAGAVFGMLAVSLIRHVDRFYAPVDGADSRGGGVR